MTRRLIPAHRPAALVFPVLALVGVGLLVPAVGWLLLVVLAVAVVALVVAVIRAARR